LVFFLAPDLVLIGAYVIHKFREIFFPIAHGRLQAGLSAGQTGCFSASAYNASGSSSGDLHEVSYAIPVSNAAPSAPVVPNVPSSTMVGSSAAFTTSATDPNGDAVEFCYNWGNGVTACGAASAWLGGQTVPAARTESPNFNWAGAANRNPTLSPRASRSLSCGSGFPAAKIEAESLSHKNANVPADSATPDVMA
jgi:hypothetical protein